MPENLTISEALASLRTQLVTAIEDAEGEELSFLCRAIEVQLQVTVTTTTKGSAKAGLWSVVTVGGDLERAKADVHQVKLTLEPTFGGGSVPVGD